MGLWEYICGYKSGIFRIIDIEYKNGVINLEIGSFNVTEDKILNKLYFTGNKIEKKEAFDNQYLQYTCSNEIGDVFVICKFKKN